MEKFLGFLLAGFALAGSPGPNTLSLAATGAAFGARCGFAYLWGLLVGMLAVMAIVATGLAGLVLALPGAGPVVTIFAVAYFFYLAFRIATAPPLSTGTQHDRQPSFVSGVILSLMNPKGYAAMAALFSGFQLVRTQLALDVAAKIMVLAVVILSVNVAWLFAGAALKQLFQEPRTSRIINISFAVLLLASVAFAFLI